MEQNYEEGIEWESGMLQNDARSIYGRMKDEVMNSYGEDSILL